METIYDDRFEILKILYPSWSTLEGGKGAKKGRDGKFYLPAGSNATKRMGVMGDDKDPNNPMLKPGGKPNPKYKKPASTTGIMSNAEYEKLSGAERNMKALEALGVKVDSPLDAAEKLANISTIMRMGEGMTPQKAANRLDRYPDGDIPQIQVFSRGDFQGLKDEQPKLVSNMLNLARAQNFTGNERQKVAKAMEYSFSLNTRIKGNREAAESMIVQEKLFSAVPANVITRSVLTGEKLDRSPYVTGYE